MKILIVGDEQSIARALKHFQAHVHME